MARFKQSDPPTAREVFAFLADPENDPQWSAERRSLPDQKVKVRILLPQPNRDLLDGFTVELSLDPRAGAGLDTVSSVLE